MSTQKPVFDRRQFLRLASTAGVSMALAACSFDPSVLEIQDQSKAPQDAMVAKVTSTEAMDSGSTVSVYKMGSTKIHTYTGGPAGNGTYIVESENSLVLVDAQFLAPIAQEFRGYADSLSKPIDRMIITHEHPDHWFGLGAAFEDVDLYTSAGTQAFLNNAGPGILESRAESMGAVNAFVEISNVLPDGGETIDGITYEYRVYQAAEADEQVVTLLPDHGTMLIGDLVYNNWHLVLSSEFDNWISYLDELGGLEGYSLVLPGHGLPGSLETITDTSDYLVTARDLFSSADGPDDFKTKMLDIYPDREGAFFWDLILGRLYPPAS